MAIINYGSDSRFSLLVICLKFSKGTLFIGWGWGVINKKLREGYACKRAIENLEKKKNKKFGLS